MENVFEGTHGRSALTMTGTSETRAWDELDQKNSAKLKATHIEENVTGQVDRGGGSV